MSWMLPSTEAPGLDEPLISQATAVRRGRCVSVRIGLHATFVILRIQQPSTGTCHISMKQ